MKILFVAERYWPEVGAAPTRLENMAVGLRKEGCEVDILTSLPNYPRGRIYEGYRGCIHKHEDHLGVNIFRYWIYATISRNPLARIINMFSFAFIIWFFAHKRKRIKGYDYVVIQTPTLVVATSAMILFKSIFKKRCILNVSDIWPMTAVDMGAMSINGFSFKFMASLEKYLYKKADGILGQSEEILNHVEQEIMVMTGKWHHPSNKDSDVILNSKMWQQNPRLFLYRNLQDYQIDNSYRTKGETLKLVFCGMLGVAQDVASIVRNVPFNELGVEFHIIGGGKQLEEIEEYCISNPNCMVYTYGLVPKEQINKRLLGMDVGIVPLSSRIRGAFPSKLFEMISQGLPVLFCGEGEGASFIKNKGLGFTSSPNDYMALIKNIKIMRDMSSADYEVMSSRCIKISLEEFNFKKQVKDCKFFLEHL